MSSRKVTTNTLTGRFASPRDLAARGGVAERITQDEARGWKIEALRNSNSAAQGP